MKAIDLRSDTVTRPTEAMRREVASAEVGDDVYGEDPTVNRLQERAVELTGKEAALFVTSGTMGNEAAIAAATHPGDAVLVGEGAHILLYESAAAAALFGVQLETVGAGGFFSGAEVADAIRPVNVHHAPARMLAIENTHNQSGGRVFPLDQLKEAAAVARDHGLTVHLDGARIFNAARRKPNTGGDLGGALRLTDVLSFEGTRRTDWVRSVWVVGIHFARTPRPQADGWRNASVGHHRCGWSPCTGTSRRTPRGRPLERATPGRRAAGSRFQSRPIPRNEHRVL